MPLGGVVMHDAEAHRRFMGPTKTDDELLLMEAIRVAQLEAGKKLFNAWKAKEREAEKAQEQKAAKARERKAARARAQKKAAKAREIKLRMGQGTKTEKKRQGGRFVSLPSGLTMSRSALAETRQRASSQFGAEPSFIKNQKSKDKAPTIMDSAAKFLLHKDTAKGIKRPSSAVPRRTSLTYRAFCLC